MMWVSVKQILESGDSAGRTGGRDPGAEEVGEQDEVKAVKCGWTSRSTCSTESRPVIPDGSNV